MAELWIALRRICVVLGLGALPFSLLVAFGIVATHGSQQAIDLHTAWRAGAKYLHGRSPYPAGIDSFVAAGPHQSFIQTPFVAALFAPVSQLPYTLVAAAVVLVLSASIVAALWLLGVRDWRCYGAIFLCPSTLTAISIGTLTPLVLLALAVAWRWRRSVPVTGLALGAAVAAKLLVWPALLWLWATGRQRGAVAAALVATGLLALATVPLGARTSHLYLTLLRHDSLVVGPLSYGVASLAPLGSRLALAALEVTSAGLLVAVLAVGRRPLAADGTLYSAAIACSLVLSPIVHLHYFVLMFAALAVRRRRFSAAWLVPALLWVTPTQDSAGEVWRTVVVLLVGIATFLEPWNVTRVLVAHPAVNDTE